MNRSNASFKALASLLCAVWFLNLSLPMTAVAMDDQKIEMGQLGQTPVQAAAAATTTAAPVADPGIAAAAATGLPGWVIPTLSTMGLYMFIVTVVAIIIPIIIRTHDYCDPNNNGSSINDTICENSTQPNCYDITRVIWDCAQAALCYVNQSNIPR